MRSVGVKCEECTFEVLAIGPIWPEQVDFESHLSIRDQMAALERAVADELRQRGEVVLGAHLQAGNPDQTVLQRIRTLLDPKFPQFARPS